jgi:hypothetical protein
MRGGAEAPLETDELEVKFVENARYGGWTSTAADRLLVTSRQLFTEPTLEVLKEFRG